MSKTAKIVLLDADVISHFIVCSELLYLHKILAPHSLRILDQVYLEIARIPSRKLVLDNFWLPFGKCKEYSSPLLI